MVPGVSNLVGAERARDLRVAADRERAALASALDRRQRWGLRLIALGEKLTHEPKSQRLAVPCP